MMRSAGTRRGSVTAAVLAGTAAVLMAGGQVLPVMRNAAAVIWLVALALLIGAIVTAVISFARAQRR